MAMGKSNESLRKLVLYIIMICNAHCDKLYERSLTTHQDETSYVESRECIAFVDFSCLCLFQLPTCVVYAPTGFAERSVDDLATLYDKDITSITSYEESC